MKKYRRLIQFGTFYRLVSPFEGNEMAWMVVSEDQRNAIVGYYRILQTVNGPYRKIRLQGAWIRIKYIISPELKKIFTVTNFVVRTGCIRCFLRENQENIMEETGIINPNCFF